MSIRHRLESELKDLRAEVGSLAIRVAECSQRIGKIESQLAEIEDYELVDSASVAPSFVASPEKPSNPTRSYAATTFGATNLLRHCQDLCRCSSY